MTTQTESATTSAAPQRKHIRHDLSWEEKREIAYKIFDRISHGEMLRDICSEEGMPHPNTLRNWAYQDTPLAFFYTCAQKLRLDGFLEELMDLTDLPAPTCKDARGNVRVDTAGVAFMKHRFEAKKWIFNILHRDPNWTDYGQRDPALAHYPDDRPLSVPPIPEPPVHSRVEQDSLSAPSGQPEGAAPEGAGNNSDSISAVTSEDSPSESAKTEQSVSPLPVHKISEPNASIVEPPAQNPQPDIKPSTLNVTSSAPPTPQSPDSFQRQLAAATHTLRFRRR